MKKLFLIPAVALVLVVVIGFAWFWPICGSNPEVGERPGVTLFITEPGTLEKVEAFKTSDGEIHETLQKAIASEIHDEVVDEVKKLFGLTDDDWGFGMHNFWQVAGATDIIINHPKEVKAIIERIEARVAEVEKVDAVTSTHLNEPTGAMLTVPFDPEWVRYDGSNATYTKDGKKILEWHQVDGGIVYYTAD